MSTQSEIAIRVENLSKIYRLYDSPKDRLKETLHPRRKKYHHDFYALRDVSFEVRKGEMMGIIGRNGSGKSTLLKILTGVLTPSSGAFEVTGNVSSLLELGTGFNPELTGIENVYFNGTLLGYSKEEMDEKLEDILTFADIGDYVNQAVKTYSSGMFVRLAFAVASSVDPSIFIIDEALAVGDVFFRQKCYQRLNELRENDTTIILVTHSMGDVEQFCNRGIILDRGSMAFLGQAHEAVKRYYLLDQSTESIYNSQPPLQEYSMNSTHIDMTDGGESIIKKPPPEAFFNTASLSQVSNGMARCTGVALCDEYGNPCRAFEQGQKAVFYYEFEILNDIEVPIAGLQIQNDKGIIIHGKTTLEYGTEVPEYCNAGAILRYYQMIKLDISIGEYTFEVGFSTIPLNKYRVKKTISHTELNIHKTIISMTINLGPFSINFRKQFDPVQLLHHGVSDLPGSIIFQLET